jgi:hypothetical protein
MIQPAADEGRPNIVELQERRLGRTILRTYRTMLDLDDVVPNGSVPASQRERLHHRTLQPPEVCSGRQVLATFLPDTTLYEGYIGNAPLAAI